MTWNKKLDPFEMQDATKKASPPPPNSAANMRLDDLDSCFDTVDRTLNYLVVPLEPGLLDHIPNWTKGYRHSG